MGTKMKKSHRISLAAAALSFMSAISFAAPTTQTPQRFCYLEEELSPCTVPATQQQIEQALPMEKRTKRGLYLDATAAHQWLQQEAAATLFLDIRTLDERSFTGSPAGVDAHVPYMVVAQPPRWDAKNNRYFQELNANFVQAVDAQIRAKHLGKVSPIVLICRSGDRSAKAADLLALAGYDNVHSVVDGYDGDVSADGERNINGWRVAKLPWTFTNAQKTAY
jgi:rhodanese-related sulfurtransferase